LSGQPENITRLAMKAPPLLHETAKIRFFRPFGAA
jgi:hypothetical protein